MKIKWIFLCFSLLICTNFAKDEFYKTLGVKTTASEAEIKKAYRKLAKKWHPDRHRDEKKKEVAEAKFMKISEAYETLSDPEKRKVYDQVGDDYEKYNHQSGPSGSGGSQGRNRGNFNFQQSGPGGFSGFQNFGHHHSQPDFGPDIFNMFANMFGHNQRPGSGRTANANRGFQGRGSGLNNGQIAHEVKQSILRHFSHSTVRILEGEEIKETVGKSFRGNNFWVVLLAKSQIKSDFANTMQILSEKFSGALQFAVVDCFSKKNEKFCIKLLPSEEKGLFLTTFNPYQKAIVNQVPSAKALKNVVQSSMKMFPTPNFIKLIDIKKQLLEIAKECIKSKDKPLGCVVILSDKIETEGEISWKLKVIAHKLKDRAGITVAYVPKKRLANLKETMKVSSLPSVAVYRNTKANRFEVGIDNFKVEKLHTNSLMYLTDMLTKDIWS